MPADNILRDVVPGILTAITPSDTVDFPAPIRGLIIGGSAGTISVVGPLDEVVSLPATMAAGVIHSIRAKRINAAGTTATGLIGVL